MSPSIPPACTSRVLQYSLCHHLIETGSMSGPTINFHDFQTDDGGFGRIFQGDWTTMLSSGAVFIRDEQRVINTAPHHMPVRELGLPCSRSFHAESTNPDTFTLQHVCPALAKPFFPRCVIHCICLNLCKSISLMLYLFTGHSAQGRQPSL